MSETLYAVDGADFTLYLDVSGHIRKTSFRDQEFEFPLGCTIYEIGGEECDTKYLAREEGLSYRLSGGAHAASLTIAAGKEVTFRVLPDKTESLQRVSLAVFLPADAVLHLAENLNIGRRIDADMPVGESYRCALQYNFLLVHTGDMWLRFRTNHEHHSTADVEIARHHQAFGVTYSWTTDTEACIAVFSTMEEALDDFKSWIEKEFAIRKLGDGARKLPDWIHNVRLTITADMLRSNWDISHDYADVLNLARELKDSGCPEDTLFYIPGWQGAYDSTHPTYRPHPELGGEDAFRRMVDGLHDCGFRVMIHTTGWGIDPYHPDIDRLEKLVMRDEDGDYRGWQINQKWAPAKKSMKFRTGRVPLGASAGSRSFAFETVELPDWCEALITLGDVGVGKGRVRLTVDRRSISSPPGWFADHASYDYPFPLLLQPGENEIQVEVTGEEEPDWSDSWYHIRYCFIPQSPYGSWTWPILMADMTHPDYVDIFSKNVSAVVREFGIDAVHVDATFLGQLDVRPPSESLLYGLRESLPEIPICSEHVQSFEAMGYWTFSQGATQSLIDYTHAGRPPREQGSLPSRDGVDELYGWLNKESPVCGFAKEYFYSYPHLCAANAFVPVGKVCNIFPPRRIPRTSEAQWRVLRNASRMDYVPGLRVNYREYGLDPDTKKAIRELSE